MSMASIIAGLVSALYQPKLAWNVLKHGFDNENDKRTDKDIQDFIDNIIEMRKDIEKICKRDPSNPLCAQRDYWNDEKWGIPKEDPMAKNKVAKKDLNKNTVKLK